MRASPWRQGYSPSAGGCGCTVVVVPVQVVVLPVVGGGSSPSPEASDGCPLRLLLLAVVLLSAVQVAVLAEVLAAVQVAVLAAVQVQVPVLPVVGGGSSPSPAASNGCPLGLLLLTIVVLAVVQVAVQVVVLATVQVAVLAVVLVATRPSPAGLDS
ncbi:hypothetical protein NDU88_004572 [Pleurodeles waltl]|uniref:Uncharacterized protein n=1 Tax=Pleurodeles waltl TaxID=8319 RepID=A0AAV7QCQ2_PLEWA|nr:hypothetical protein NDU88_004572 [Pleurodeles waltl]